MKRIFNWRNCIVLLLVLVAVISLLMTDFAGSSGEAQAEKVFPEFPADSPGKIELSWKNTCTTLLLVNGNWEVAERGNHAADTSKIADFAEQVRKLRPLRKAVPQTREICSELRVNPEESDPLKVPGLRVRIWDTAGNLLRDMTLGAGFFTDPAQANDPQSVPDGRWIARILPDGSAEPYLISSVFEEYHPLPGSWMSCPVIDRINQTVNLYFQEKSGNRWMLARVSPQDAFSPVMPAGGKVISRQKVGALFSALTHRYTFEGVRENKAGTLKEEGSLSIASADGLIRQLHFYRTDAWKDGVLCRVSAKVRKKKAEAGAEARAKAFLDGRSGWFYFIPNEIYEVIRTNPVEK